MRRGLTLLTFLKRAAIGVPLALLVVACVVPPLQERAHQRAQTKAFLEIVRRRDAAGVRHWLERNQPSADAHWHQDLLKHVAHVALCDLENPGYLQTSPLVLDIWRAIVESRQDRDDWVCRRLLRLAAIYGAPELVGVLIARGINVDLPCMGDRSALAIAAELPDEKLVSVLLKHGADPNREFAFQYDGPRMKLLPYLRAYISIPQESHPPPGWKTEREESYATVIRLLKKHGARE